MMIRPDSEDANR